MTPARARHDRAVLEAILAEFGWPWIPGISRYLDLLIALEERRR